MRYLFILFLFCACNPLRHYTKVATDPFRNSKERELLSRACIQEFPAVRDTPKVVYTGIDSSDYLAVNEAYLKLLDSLIAMSNDTAFTATGTDNRPVLAYWFDSIRVVRNFLRTYKPPAVIKTVVKEVPVRNTAIEHQLQTSIDYARSENQGLVKQRDEAVDKKKKAKTTNVGSVSV